MYKVLISLCLLIGLGEYGNAQVNLVPNGSFENYTACPDAASQLNRLTGWFNANAGTVDFYHSCFTIGSSNMDVPNNFFGSQTSVSGNGYIGLFMHYYYTLYREYAEIKLSDTLVAGTKYYVSFSVSLADSANFATDDIGVHFSNDSLLNLYSFDNFSVIPHVQNIEDDFLSDKSIWYFVSGEYIATGNEKFLTIGNFKNDVNTDTIHVSLGGSMLNDYFCYYYIDDICVSSIADNCGMVDIIEPTKTNISIFPNPSNGIITISGDELIESIFLYSAVGELLIEEVPQSGYYQIDLSSFSDGIYLLTIKTTQSITSEKIIVY